MQQKLEDLLTHRRIFYFLRSRIHLLRGFDVRSLKKFHEVKILNHQSTSGLCANELIQCAQFAH